MLKDILVAFVSQDISVTVWNLGTMKYVIPTDANPVMSSSMPVSIVVVLIVYRRGLS